MGYHGNKHQGGMKESQGGSQKPEVITVSAAVTLNNWLIQLNLSLTTACNFFSSLAKLLNISFTSLQRINLSQWCMYVYKSQQHCWWQVGQQTRLRS